MESLAKIRKKWLAGQIEPVYFFYGQEDFLIKRYISEIQTKVLDPADKDFNFDLFFGNESDGAQIVNAATSYPMMAEKRMVIVKEVQLLSTKSLELLENYVSKPLPTTCLVLVADKAPPKRSPLEKIRKSSVSIELKPLYDSQVPDWIRGYLKESNLTITDEALRLLHANTGNSLRTISSEIEKIKLNMGDRNRIELSDVEMVVGTSKQYNVFELCDAVGSRNLKSSLHILDRMIQLGEQPVGILNMLSRHFMILAKIKDLKARRTHDKEIAQKLRIHPYFLGNYVLQANKYNKQQLGRAFELLLSADENLKSSYQKPKMILELLLFKLHSL